MRVPLPLRGLCDATASADQPVLTTGDARNVRPVDCKSGRVRLSQRAGLSKYLSARDADAAVRWLGQVAYDGRKFTYSASDPPVQEWAYVTPSASEAQLGVLDRQGNVYTVTGRSNVTKVNPSGETVWTFTAAVKDARQRVGAVFVDDLDNVYLGVTEGGQQSLGRLWRLSQKRGQQPKQEWEVPIDGYVQRVLVRGDLVYTLENRPDRWGAQVVCRRGGLSTGPTQVWATDVAYPANDLVLKADGSLVGCSPPFEDRGLDPRYPLFTEKTNDATLRDILGDRYDETVWRDMDASTLDVALNTTGVRAVTGDTKIRHGDNVEYWPDSSGAERDMFLRVTIANQTPPQYNAKGIAGLPSVFFRGNVTLGSSTSADALQTNFSASSNPSYADQHQGLVPGYTGATWVMFLVMRPQQGGDIATASARQVVWGQPASISGVSDFRQSLLTNRDDATNIADGYGTFYDATSSNGVGTGTQTIINRAPNQFQYGTAAGADNQPSTGNPTGTVILTIMCDGGVNDGLADGGGTMHSLLRVNGKPIDRWETVLGSNTTLPGILGAGHNASSTVHFKGDIARLIVLHKPGVPPEAGPITHPHYPHNIHTAAVAPTGAAYNAVTPFTATEMEKIEGMLAHRYGMSHLLPASGAVTPTYSAVAPFKTTNNHGNYPHPFYRQNGPPRQSGTNVRSEPYQMHTKNGCVWKLEGAKGELQWVVTGTSGEDGGGLGYSVAVTSQGNVYSVGPKLAVGSALIDGTTSAVGTGDINVRLIEDKNAKGIDGYNTLVTIGEVPWIATLGTTSDDFDTTRIKCAVDEFDNLYVPINYSAIGPFSLKVYAYAPDTSGGSNAGNEIASYTDPNSAQAYGVVVPPAPPYRYGASYDWDRNPTTDARQVRAEFAYLFQAQTTSPSRDPGVTKVRLVAATPTNTPQRQTTLIQVVGGKVLKFTDSGLSSFAGASTLAEPQLSPTAQFIDGDVLFGKAYITDGDKIVVVDPVLDTVTLLKAADGGKVPEHCKLLKGWRGRLVLARATDDPQNVHLGEMGNPRGWDRFGVPLLPTRAVSLNAARVQMPPDTVNAIVPYSDHVQILLCDHSVWALVGDPADEGQRAGLRQVSATTGGAFGRSWAMDPDGTLYWFGSRGGLWRMRGEGNPEEVTEGLIPARLAAVDLATYRVELAWDTSQDGLHVLLIPQQSDDASVDTVHYFWKAKTDECPEGIWEDTFAFPPASVLVADGDEEDDRVLLFGGHDGYVRKLDPASKNDDGVAIKARCRVGPFVPEESDFEFRFSALSGVLASDQDPVQVSVHRSSVPDDIGARVATVELRPGRNRDWPIRAAGAYLWLVVEQAHVARRWSIESLAVTATRGARKGARV